MLDVLPNHEPVAHFAEDASALKHAVAYVVEPEEAIAAVMRASPAETAGQDANGHVIAEEANPAELPVQARQDAGANVGHAEEGEQEAAAEDDLQEVFAYVASTAVGLALAYTQKVEAS